MRLKCPGFDQEIIWHEEKLANELVIENQVYWRQAIDNLINHQDDSDGISITVKGKAINYSDELEIITNPLGLDFNNRRVNLALQKLLTQASVSEKNYLFTQELKTKIASYLVDLVESMQINFQVSTDDFAVTQLAKAVNLHVISDDNLLAQLIDYQELIRELTKVKLTVFINLRSFLNDNELLKLLAANRDHQLSCLLIESTARKRLDDLPRMVIDQDLCSI